jgi:hypothetical protein
MTMKTPWTVFLLAGVLAQVGASALPAELEAQEIRELKPTAAVGINFLVGDPLGEFSDYVDAGFGAEFYGRFPLEPQGLVSLRADLGFMIYGYESSRVCFEGVGCRVQARLQTTNNIFYGGIGPELALPLNGFRPYVNASLGFGYFNTTSSLESLWGEEDSFSTENLGDGAFSLGIGWGMEINLHRGRIPVFLNLGGRYHKNGVMTYLTEGDIQDNPDGSITLFPVVSEADLVSYRVGVTIGIPRGG